MKSTKLLKLITKYEYLKDLKNKITKENLMTNKQINEAYENIYLEEHALQCFNDILILTDDSLNEANWLSKLGLHVKKGKGLIQYFAQFGAGMAKLFKAAIKKDKAEVKRIIATEISKEDLIDFVMKLDMASLHILSTPIHFIESITGLHIAANLGNITDSVKTVVKDAYDKIVMHMKDVFGHTDTSLVTLKDLKKQIKEI